MKEGIVEKIFFYLARLTIIVPIIVVIVAILIRVSKKNPTDFKPSPKVMISPSVKITTDSAKERAKEASPAALFSLKGPLVCNFIDNGATISAYIKNKNILAQVSQKDTVKNYLLKDDCFYQWEKGRYNGEKFCGLSPYLSIFEQLSSFGILDFESLLKFIPQEELKDKLKSNNQINKAVKQCQKKEVEEVIFNIPANVLFKNSSTTSK